MNVKQLKAALEEVPEDLTVIFEYQVDYMEANESYNIDRVELQFGDFLILVSDNVGGADV